MAVCEICGKGTQFGHNVSHANNKTLRSWKANLQRIRIQDGKRVRRAYICTKCIKSNKVVKAV